MSAAVAADALSEVLDWHGELCRRAERIDPDWWLSEGSRLTLWYPADLAALLGGREAPAPAAPSDLRAAASLARRLPLARRKAPKAEAVAFSYSLRAEILAKQDDHYFGAMLDEAPKNVLWAYYLDAAGERRAVLEHLARKDRRGLIYTDLLGLSDLPGLLSQAAGLRRRLSALASQAPPFVPGFAERFLAACLGRLPLVELGVRLAFERLLADSGARAVLYPYEEKGIERAILSAARGRAKTLAFAHAIYNDGHLYARAKGAPRPDLLLATGPAARDWWVREAGWPADRVRSIGSPRHPGAPLPASTPGRPLKVLFFAGYEHEVPALARWVERDPGLFAGCELRVRPYPYKWAEGQEKGLALLRRLIPSLKVDLDPLDDQVRWCDLTLFDSTSAGFHAMLRGRPAVRVALHDAFETDPTAGKGGEGIVPRCGSPEELKAALARLPDAARQRAFAETVYAPPDRAALAAALEEGPS